MNKLVDAIYDEIETYGGHRNKGSIANQLRQLDGRHDWVLVPVEPTEDMRSHIDNFAAREIWRRILAASPDPLD